MRATPYARRAHLSRAARTSRISPPELTAAPELPELIAENHESSDEGSATATMSDASDRFSVVMLDWILPALAAPGVPRPAAGNALDLVSASAEEPERTQLRICRYRRSSSGYRTQKLPTGAPCSDCPDPIDVGMMVMYVHADWWDDQHPHLLGAFAQRINMEGNSAAAAMGRKESFLR